MRKIFFDFEIKMDNQNSDRRPALVLIDKKKITCNLEDFALPAGDKGRNSKKRKTNIWILPEA